jgi:hypothetical protein
VKCDDFVQAIAWTKKEWMKRPKRPERRCPKYSCFSYKDLRLRGDDYWLHLENMSESDLATEIINCFLNTRRWDCHLYRPETPQGKETVRNLKKAVAQLTDYYTALERFSLDDIEFQKETTFWIDCIYSFFRQIKPKFGAVAASKLMHMALPNLFMMWDDDIIKEYGVRKQVLPYFGRPVWSYAAFLVLMQENIRHIKETNPLGSCVTNQELYLKINEHIGEMNLPVTRLLDMANFAISRGKITYQKCHRCIDVTKRRLEALEWYDEQAKPRKPFFDS